MESATKRSKLMWIRSANSHTGPAANSCISRPDSKQQSNFVFTAKSHLHPMEARRCLVGHINLVGCARRTPQRPMTTYQPTLWRNVHV